MALRYRDLEDVFNLLELGENSTFLNLLKSPQRTSCHHVRSLILSQVSGLATWTFSSSLRTPLCSRPALLAEGCSPWPAPFQPDKSCSVFRLQNYKIFLILAFLVSWAFLGIPSTTIFCAYACILNVIPLRTSFLWYIWKKAVFGSWPFWIYWLGIDFTTSRSPVFYSQQGFGYYLVCPPFVTLGPSSPSILAVSSAGGNVRKATILFTDL